MVLKQLYNAITNDYSIQRYSLGYVDVLESIERRYKTIERTNDEFTDELLLKAIVLSKGNLRKTLVAFSRELSISLDTLREKENRGSQTVY